jgi:hypothetical protein
MGSAVQVREWKRKHPARKARQGQQENMRFVIRTLGMEAPLNVSSDVLYDLLVQTVLKDPAVSKEKFPFGKPDARNRKVEYKIGFDKLHKSQFIWNILNGHDCRIRWFPSYDALEDAIEGRPFEGKIFRTYRDFILWEYGEGTGYGTIHKAEA